MHQLAALMIFKDERLRIAEWLAWHRMVGVDFFLLFDNDDEPCPETHAILAPYVAAGLAEVVRMPGRPKQAEAYFQGRDRFNRDAPAAKWVAVIDSDEFLDPEPPFRTVLQAIEPFERADVAGVIASWACFGSCGFRDPPELVTESLVTRAPDGFRWNGLGKTIFRPRRVGSHRTPHDFAAYDGYRVVDVRGATRTDAFVYPITFERLRVAHYITRSESEYRRKLARGYADQTRPREDCWEELNANDVMDRRLADRVPELRRWLANPGAKSV